MTPVYRILADNKDITAAIGENLISLNHHDQRGVESDTLNIVIKDDHTLELPRKGVALTLHLGFAGRPLVERGTFKVDEVAQANQGSGDEIIIDCKAADMQGALKSEKTRSWHSTTLGKILADVANGQGLQVRVSDGLSAIAIEHEDQTGESDMHLVTRLAHKHDAQVKISDGFLAVTFRNEGKTASGAALSSFTISRSDGDTHHYVAPDREQFGTVQALYRDTATGETHKVAAGGGEPVRQLGNKVHASKADALEAAKGELSRMEGGKETMELDLAVADCTLFAEMGGTLEGFRREIDGGGWFIDSIDTVLDDGGLTQTMNLERGGKE